MGQHQMHGHNMAIQVGEISCICLSYMQYSAHLRNLPASLGSRHTLNVLTSMTLSPLTVDEAQTAGLSLAINESTRKSSHDLLGLVVTLRRAYCLPWHISLCYISMCLGSEEVVFLTVLRAVVLVGLGGFVRSGTGDQLMSERGVVLGLDTAVVVLIVGVSLVRVV